MGYVEKTNIAHRSNYGNQRSTSNIKYAIVHYTGNDGDTDEANANYFKGANRNASAHYFIDDDSVTNSVPDNYTAWAVGGGKWDDCWLTGGGSRYKQATNSNSISFEICDTIRNGEVYPSDATIENATTFIARKMIEYNIPIGNLIRHFDVNGKHCPDWACITERGNLMWFFFVQIVQKKINEGGGTNIPTYDVPDAPNETDWSSAENAVEKGQREANKFVGHSEIAVDGIKGPQTKKMRIRVLQHAMNLDYDAGLAEDGIWGPKTERALGNHYVKRGERQYMVTAMEIIALLNGVDPNGVEYPGIFGQGLTDAFNGMEYIDANCMRFVSCA